MDREEGQYLIVEAADWTFAGYSPEGCESAKRLAANAAGTVNNPAEYPCKVALYSAHARVRAKKRPADPWRVWAEYGRLLANVIGPTGGAFRPNWRGAPAVKLARIIYELHAFHLLPDLADTLEEIGCEDHVVLAHLRWPGPFCRGDWVLDALLELI